jgi:hypothetical protein
MALLPADREPIRMTVCPLRAPTPRHGRRTQGSYALPMSKLFGSPTSLRGAELVSDRVSRPRDSKRNLRAGIGAFLGCAAAASVLVGHAALGQTKTRPPDHRAAAGRFRLFGQCVLHARAFGQPVGPPVSGCTAARKRSRHHHRARCADTVVLGRLSRAASALVGHPSRDALCGDAARPARGRRSDHTRLSGPPLRDV